MNVIALLPYLVHNYENPSQLCRDSADHISQVRFYDSSFLSKLIKSFYALTKN